MSVTEGPVALVMLALYFGGKNVAVPFCRVLEGGDE
jgi:hypothetical protein